jgi:cell wall-associated NlpC family hydrolase
MTAITESTLTNVDHGDESGPSSIGVFQQMTSWGSLAQRTDPAQAAGLFFDRMVNVPDWQSIDPWMAAQDVQESEFPDGSNYQSSVNQAQSITSVLLVTATPGGDSTTAPVSAPNPQAQIAVDFALAQIGKKFAFGGTGPQTFDSSGLTFTSWAQAGVNIPRASFQQATLRAIPMTQLQPGDLITTNVPVSHAAIYVGDGMAVSAASEQLGIVEIPLSKIGAHPTAHRVQP